MSNIRFNYLYRDGGNFKFWGEVIFANPKRLSLKGVETRLNRAFLPDGLFIASQIAIPEKFPFPKVAINQNDHCFHEFDCIETCTGNTTDSLERSVSEFLEEVERCATRGWKAFNVLERI